MLCKTPIKWFFWLFFCQIFFFAGFYKMTLLLKTWIFSPKSSNEDNFEPSRMLSSHLQPKTPKTWQTRAWGLGYFKISFFFFTESAPRPINLISNNLLELYSPTEHHSPFCATLRNLCNKKKHIKKTGLNK